MLSLAVFSCFLWTATKVCVSSDLLQYLPLNCLWKRLHTNIKIISYHSLGLISIVIRQTKPKTISYFQKKKKKNLFSTGSSTIFHQIHFYILRYVTMYIVVFNGESIKIEREWEKEIEEKSDFICDACLYQSHEKKKKRLFVIQ